MIAGLQAAQVVLIIILGLSGLACLFWFIAISLIDIGDLIHRLTRTDEHHD